MSRYMMIRRLRGPAFLLLVGVIALLAQAHILGWSKSWPLYLILAGVLQLAERTALAAEGGYPPSPYPGAPYGAPVNPSAPAGTPQNPAQPSTGAIVPAYSHEIERDPNGGQS
jgi:hypothetical protein